MYLLLLEPQKDRNAFIKKGLLREGYNVSSLTTSNEIETFLSNKNSPHPCVILIDSELDPEENHPLVHRLKERWNEAPILVLSSTANPHQKSTFLDEGADDCMSQPISLEELSARIRVLRRRNKVSSTQHQIQFGNTLIDYFQQSIFVNSQRLMLSRKEFEVLKLLMEHPQRVYNKMQILDQIWDVHSDVESNVVEVTIKNLRKKISQKGSNLKIESRRHFGYWIELWEGARAGF